MTAPPPTVYKTPTRRDEMVAVVGSLTVVLAEVARNISSDLNVQVRQVRSSVRRTSNLEDEASHKQ